MRAMIPIQNPRTGEIKSIKLGWSWTVFLFSGLFGLPLFMRRLYLWGGVIAFIRTFNILMPESIIATLPPEGFLWLWLSIKGNELTAKNLLEHGWFFSEPDSKTTEFAMQKWRLRPVNQLQRKQPTISYQNRNEHEETSIKEAVPVRRNDAATVNAFFKVFWLGLLTLAIASFFFSRFPINLKCIFSDCQVRPLGVSKNTSILVGEYTLRDSVADISEINDDSSNSRLELNLVVAIKSGCTGEFKGIGTYSPSYNSVIFNDLEESACTVTVTSGKDANTIHLEDTGCSQKHGSACGFDNGEYIAQKSAPRSAITPIETKAENKRLEDLEPSKWPLRKHQDQMTDVVTLQASNTISDENDYTVNTTALCDENGDILSRQIGAEFKGAPNIQFVITVTDSLGREKKFEGEQIFRLDKSSPKGVPVFISSNKNEMRIIFSPLKLDTMADGAVGGLDTAVYPFGEIKDLKRAKTLKLKLSLSQNKATYIEIKLQELQHFFSQCNVIN